MGKYKIAAVLPIDRRAAVFLDVRTLNSCILLLENNVLRYDRRHRDRATHDRLVGVYAVIDSVDSDGIFLENARFAGNGLILDIPDLIVRVIGHDAIDDDVTLDDLDDLAGDLNILECVGIRISRVVLVIALGIGGCLLVDREGRLRCRSG